VQSTGTNTEVSPQNYRYFWFGREPVLSWGRHDRESLRNLNTREPGLGQVVERDEK